MRPSPRELTRAVSRVPVGAGSAVMGTGVLSIGFALLAVDWLSILLLVVGVLLWLALAGVFLVRLVRHWDRWWTEADVPPSLTSVAGTCVLGTRFTLLHWHWLAAAMLAVGSVLWVVLLPLVLRHWKTPTVGVSFLICVSAEALAVLGATLARFTDAVWLALAAGAVFLLGVLLYLAVLVRFDLRQIAVGRGDHWVAGGALAICALAGGKLLAARALLPGPSSSLTVLVLALWALAALWYVILAAGELRWPRTRYHVQRWSTVFPLGMMATASLTIWRDEHLPWMRVLGTALLWVALVVWVLTSFGASRHLIADFQSPQPDIEPGHAARR